MFCGVLVHGLRLCVCGPRIVLFCLILDATIKGVEATSALNWSSRVGRRNILRQPAWAGVLDVVSTAELRGACLTDVSSLYGSLPGASSLDSTSAVQPKSLA